MWWRCCCPLWLCTHCLLRKSIHCILLCVCVCVCSPWIFASRLIVSRIGHIHIITRFPYYIILYYVMLCYVRDCLSVSYYIQISPLYYIMLETVFQCVCVCVCVAELEWFNRCAVDYWNGGSLACGDTCATFVNARGKLFTQAQKTGIIN